MSTPLAKAGLCLAHCLTAAVLLVAVYSFLSAFLNAAVPLVYPVPVRRHIERRVRPKNRYHKRSRRMFTKKEKGHEVCQSEGPAIGF